MAKNTGRKNRKAVIGFDDVADTSKIKGEKETMKEKREPELIEMSGSLKVEMNKPVVVDLEEEVKIDMEVKDLNDHFFKEKEDDGSDEHIIEKLSTEPKEEESVSEVTEDDMRAYQSGLLNDAFPYIAQEIVEAKLKGGEFPKRKEIKKLLIKKTVDFAMQDPEKAKVIEETGGRRIFEEEIEEVLQLPGVEAKYERLIDELINFSTEELKEGLEKIQEGIEKKESEVYLITSDQKKDLSEETEVEEPKRLKDVIKAYDVEEESRRAKERRAHERMMRMAARKEERRAKETRLGATQLVTIPASMQPSVERFSNGNAFGRRRATV